MTGLFTESLFAVSRSNDPNNLPQRFDAPMLLRPVRSFLAVFVLPTLAAPLAAIHGFGYVRCLASMNLPKKTNIPKYEDRLTPEFVVYKRMYDHTLKKVIETTVSQESEDLKEALAVVGKRRSEYVDDGRGNSYYVMERKQLNKAYMYRRERWAYALLSDVFRHFLPMCACLVFFPSMRRFNTDVIAWWRGGLVWWKIRHPVPNFFLSVNDYNRAKYRIQKRTGFNPVQTKPWTPIQ